MRLATAFLLLLALSVAAWALKPVPPSALETPLTYWDETGYGRDLGGRVLDIRDGHLESVSELAEGPFPGSPEAAARAFLESHPDWTGLKSTADLALVRVAESPMGYHVRFERMAGGVPVYPGDLVVTLDRRNVVRFYFSSLIAVPGDFKPRTGLTAEQAERIAHGHLQPKVAPEFEPEARLVVWAGDGRDFAACWRLRQFLQDPRGDWEVLVDAGTGAIRRVKDMACYIDGTGNVFRPDPVTTARVPYTTPGYGDNNDANSPQLTAQHFVDTLYDITQQGTTYRLQGPFCNLTDWDPPAGAPVTATHPDSFRFLRQAQGFEDANVYFHISTSQRWIQELGFDNIQNVSMQVDPHGVNGQDNAYYVPSTNRIAFGEGGVDDAEDADVIWHEYGHAIQHGTVPNWGGGDEGSMGEGFGDYWAGSWSRVQSDYNHTWVFNWDGHNNFWPGRNLNMNYHYPQNNNPNQIHDSGQLWSQPCYETMLLVTRAVMDQIVLQHHFLVGSGASMPTAARALLTADTDLNGGVNHWAIYDRFVPRGLLTLPPPFALSTPTGGELWVIDSTASVLWQTGALPDSVRLELSRSGPGGPWSPIVTSTTNDGRYDFTVTGPRSEDCRVRITYLGTSANTDSSDSSFAIDRVVMFFTEGFEGGANGWTHETPGGIWWDQWHLSDDRVHTGTAAWKCGDSLGGNYMSRTDAWLISPVINGIPTNGLLEFWHQIYSETVGVPDSANDGATLDIRVNGGDWVQLYPAFNGYNSMIRRAQTPTGPFPRGTRVWSSVLSEWTKVVCDIGQYAGQPVQFRFRFGSNASGNYEGWYVDDVKIYSPYRVPVPQRVTIRRSDNSIILRWRSAGPGVQYRIYSADYPGGPYDTLVGTTTATSYTIPGPIPDLPKFYTVCGWDGQP